MTSIGNLMNHIPDVNVYSPIRLEFYHSNRYLLTLLYY